MNPFQDGRRSYSSQCQINSGFVFWFQLKVFLTQRISEMREEGDVVSMSQFQLAPAVIQKQTQEHVRDMLSQVQDLLGRLTSLRMQHLFMIQASPRYHLSFNNTSPPAACRIRSGRAKGSFFNSAPTVHDRSLRCHIILMKRVFRYVERVSEMLRQKLKQAEVLVLKAVSMAERRQEALQEQSRLEPRVGVLAGRTRELQKLVLGYFY